VKVIAIDGPAGSGKSTVAKRLAHRLGLGYLDTGAMYRAVTFAALRRGIDPAEAEPVAELARAVEMEVADHSVRVDGVDATIEIRGPEVSRAVSIVAANPAVRDELVQRQRDWATRHGGGVIEGRDIGTVVCPDAPVKIYLNAETEVRARRRLAERPEIGADALATDLRLRDESDAARMRPAEDAVQIDTSELDVEDVVAQIEELVRARQPA
jgi:CMP/dCMP kinase